MKTAWCCALFASVLGTARAHAQPPVSAVRWNNGVDMSGEGRANAFTLGTVIQLDGRYGVDDPEHFVNDGLLMRRIRPILQARVARRLEFRFMPDFGNHATAIFDAYVDVRLTPHVRVRAGKEKGPVGLERLYSGAALLFPERTLVTNLVPNRDVGVQIAGDAGGVVTYSAGAYHGVPDLGSTDLAAGFGRDFNGRVELRPFARSAPAAWRNAGIAFGATAGQATGALPSFRSAPQQDFFTYTASAVADGLRTRFTPSAFYYYKSFIAFAEYARSTQTVSRAGVFTDVANSAFGVSGAFVLTRETVSERGIVPREPFNPAHHQWGAIVIAARYNRLSVDPLVFTRGLAAPAALAGARAASVAAHLYVTTNVKYVLSFERTVFLDGPQAHRPPENALIFRLQLSLQPTL